MNGQRKCLEEHYGDGVCDGSVSVVSFSKIRNGLGAGNGGTGLWILTHPIDQDNVENQNELGNTILGPILESNFHERQRLILVVWGLSTGPIFWNKADKFNELHVPHICGRASSA